MNEQIFLDNVGLLAKNVFQGNKRSHLYKILKQIELY